MSLTQARLHIGPGEESRTGSLLHSLPELKHANVLSLIDSEVERAADLLIAKVILHAGDEIPLHWHTHSETVFVLKGRVIAQRGKGIAEIAAPGAAYFPAGAPHGIRPISGAEAAFLTCYPRGDLSHPVQTTLVDPAADTAHWPNPNVIAGENLAHRWALVEEFEPEAPVEPTKGWAITVRYLLDPKRGAPDLMVGTGNQKPSTHYTIHRHAPPEIFHVLEGRGVIHVGHESYKVQKGSTVYVPSLEPHGIDTFDSPMRTYWVYGLDRCGTDWRWEAVEPIYNRPRDSRG